MVFSLSSRLFLGVLLAGVVSGGFEEAKAQAANLVEVGELVVFPGERRASLDLRAATDAPLAHVVVRLTFDESLCERIEGGACVGGPKEGARCTSSGTDECGAAAGGSCRALRAAGRVKTQPLDPGSGSLCGGGSLTLVFSDLMGGIVVPAGSGPIAEWVFDVGADAAPGVFPIRVEVVKSSFGPHEVDLGSRDGRIEIRRR